MATLQKIRNRAGIAIAIFIGVALAAFILGDLFKSTSSLTRGKAMELAEVDGKVITYPEFQSKVSELEEIYKKITAMKRLPGIFFITTQASQK